MTEAEPGAAQLELTVQCLTCGKVLFAYRGPEPRPGGVIRADHFRSLVPGQADPQPHEAILCPWCGANPFFWDYQVDLVTGQLKGRFKLRSVERGVLPP